jgi:F1F0 ATPase subunit 2
MVMGNGSIILSLGMISGIVLGIIFFGGHQWTVQKAIYAKASASWFLSSWLIRSSIVFISFYTIAREGWGIFCLCLLGFFLARLLVAKFERRSWNSHLSFSKRGPHAPYLSLLKY